MCMSPGPGADGGIGVWRVCYVSPEPGSNGGIGVCVSYVVPEPCSDGGQTLGLGHQLHETQRLLRTYA